MVLDLPTQLEVAMVWKRKERRKKRNMKRKHHLRNEQERAERKK